MSAPRIPSDEKYWLKKGKQGKKCMIYTHNDLDGIYSAIVMKHYLLEHGFEIAGYGIIEYNDSWKAIELDYTLINIALDYSEWIHGIDVFIDHHSSGSGVDIKRKGVKGAIKTDTASAYEGICIQLGLPLDIMILGVIDMVDAARYDYYNVDMKNVLDFDYSKMKNKYDFAAVFNQRLKRGDHTTFIEVIHNTHTIHPSIYETFRLFKILYPANNLFKKGPHAGGEKNFLDDSEWRLSGMKDKTRGIEENKTYIESQDNFRNLFLNNGSFSPDGYQVIGNLVYVPSGTWCNALRIRSIVEQDVENLNIPEVTYTLVGNLLPKLIRKRKKYVRLVGEVSGYGNYRTLNVTEDVSDDESIVAIEGKMEKVNNEWTVTGKPILFYAFLQYGSSLQIVTFRDIEKYCKFQMPKTKNGKIVDDLGVYADELLENFRTYFGYNIADTTSGGHKGIGNISKIVGNCFKEGFEGIKFLDLFKNKVIQDLSGVNWQSVRMKWSDSNETVPSEKTPINHRVIKLENIRTLEKNKNYFNI